MRGRREFPAPAAQTLRGILPQAPYGPDDLANRVSGYDGRDLGGRGQPVAARPLSGQGAPGTLAPTVPQGSEW